VTAGGVARWYSVDTSLRPQWREAVDVETALAVIDRCYAGLRRECVDGEEALAASLFGFGRADDDFIEFGLQPPTGEVSLTVEPAPRKASWLARLFDRDAGEYLLASRAQVERVARDYLTLSRESFAKRLAELPRP
jgi:hypothetical protein